VWPVQHIGSEFMPNLNEGTLLYMPTTLPGLSVTKSAELLQTQDRIIRTFPEVASVYGKAGRAQTATDPAPIEMFETVINLKPKEEWRPGLTVDGLIQEMDRSLQFPGVSNAWTMPIKARIDMLSTGIRTPVGVKVIGKDLAQMEKVARQIETALKTVPGTASAYSERVVGGYYLEVVPDRDRLARYGLMISDVQNVVATALGAEPITTTVEGRERYTVAVRYPRDLRSDPQAIGKDVLVALPGGGTVPLEAVADIRMTQGATSIRTENAKLATYIFVDIRGRDLGGYVADAKRAVAEQVKMPPGTYVVWSGQFEYLERAEARMKLVVPVTLMIIFLLLYLNFRRLTETFIVMLSLPFALVGGRADVVARVQHVGSGGGRFHRAGRCRRRNRRGHAHLSGQRRPRDPRTLPGRRSTLYAGGPLSGHHDRRRGARAAENDDGRRHHGGLAYHVEHGHRLRGHAAHRRADDRRHGVVDPADANRHPGHLRHRQRLAPPARRGEQDRHG
jgi:Cu(I)/Ag(I) efflux system membrane protein CusA/SilA